MNAPGEIGSVDVEGYTALWQRLNNLYGQLRTEKRGLDALDVVAARDCVEVLRDLLVEVKGHRFDSQHLHDKGVYPRPRLADVRLYERAGFPPLATKVPDGGGPDATD
jgi:hypothetical protein